MQSALGLIGDPNAAGQSLIVRSTQTATSGAASFNDGISIEPTAYNRQLSVYLNALNELRRINEGDDTSDSPGYSLNLVRIPVSILPGKMTRKGYGAEVTFTAEPQITDDLLPSTMRSLIVNDVVDMHALPVAQALLNDPGATKKLIKHLKSAEAAAESWMRVFDGWVRLFEGDLVNDVPPGDPAIRDFYARQREYMHNRTYQLAVAATKNKNEKIVIPVGLGMAGIGNSRFQIEITLAAFAATLSGIAAGYDENCPATALCQKKLDVTLVFEDPDAKEPWRIPLSVNIGLAYPYQLAGAEKYTPPFNIDVTPVEAAYGDYVAAQLKVRLCYELAECLRQKDPVDAAFSVISQLQIGYSQGEVERSDVEAFFHALETYTDIPGENLASYVLNEPKPLQSDYARTGYIPYSKLSEELKKGEFTKKAEPCACFGLLSLSASAALKELARRLNGGRKADESESTATRRPDELPAPHDKREETPATPKVKADDGAAERTIESAKVTLALIAAHYMLSNKGCCECSEATPDGSGDEDCRDGCNNNDDCWTGQPSVCKKKSGSCRVLGSSRGADFLEEYVMKPYGGDFSAKLDEIADKQDGGVSLFFESFNTTGPLSLRDRPIERPLPPSMYLQTIGFDSFAQLLIGGRRATQNIPTREQVVSYLDIRQYLIEETQRAYDWLEYEGIKFWDGEGLVALARAIRTRDFLAINALHREFEAFATLRTQPSVTATLAWSILVDAALLNERLINDMKRVSREKGCACLHGEGLSFVGPEEILSPMAQEAFKEYVRCRWPIQVFALDPRAEDQNIADQFSRRRELQLALAAGVARGTVRAGAATRFARRLETDIETISLNRTQIAFSHGSDTFGWRFYPRLQTPDTPGTLGALYETIAGGPDLDADLRDRGLEPGLRECTAVIVMPSFIPHVTFESRGSWFGLTNPRKKALTLQDAMKISRNFQAVRQGLQIATESCVYRPGDVAHMSRVVDQMERRLPLQHMLTQVPFENTLGGFEMFSTGVTDLAPELYGWYGAPGVTVKTKDVECAGDGVDLSGNQCKGTCDGTTIFLVGNRFSVHDTKVIAGGRCVPFTLVSREIMRATIPYNAGTVEHTLSDGKTKQPYVDVHVSTPYGVTSHLLVKAVKAAETKTEEELAKSVETLTETVEQIQRDVVPVTAAASSKTPKVELAAMRKATGGMEIDPVLGASDVMIEFVNQTATSLKGDIEMALLKGDVYITSRLPLDEKIEAPAKNR